MGKKSGSHNKRTKKTNLEENKKKKFHFGGKKNGPPLAREIDSTPLTITSTIRQTKKKKKNKNKTVIE